MAKSDFIRLMDPNITDDDLKVLKHLKAIDKLFKKGDLTICQLFIDNGTMNVTKEYDGGEFEIASFDNINCDGGDPDRCGDNAIHGYFEWVDKMESMSNEN